MLFNHGKFRKVVSEPEAIPKTKNKLEEQKYVFGKRLLHFPDEYVIKVFCQYVCRMKFHRCGVGDCHGNAINIFRSGLFSYFILLVCFFTPVRLHSDQPKSQTTVLSICLK